MVAHGAYDLLLVTVSYVIAVFASYLALHTLSLSKESIKGAPKYSLSNSAMAMGLGVWSMHFVAMLAFKLPFPVYYDGLITLISLLIAMATCWIGLTLAQRFRSTAFMFWGGVFIGLGIVAMHYTGMAAMQDSVAINYDPVLVLLSVIIAISAAITAIGYAFSIAERKIANTLPNKLSSAAIMGLAISGMHYTGMAAASFSPPANLQTHDLERLINPYAIGIAITVATALLIYLTLYSAYLNQRWKTLLNDSEKQSSSIISTALDGIITIDESGTIQIFNQSAERIFGYNKEAIVGQNIKQLMPEPHRSKHYQYINNYLTTGKAKILGAVREVQGQRKDGTVFPMEIAISESLSNGERLFVGIVRDATEHNLIIQQLTEAKELAEEANNAKSQFLSRMSHELRTPLNSILGFGQLLQEQSKSPQFKPLSDQIEHITKSGWHLLELVNDVLDLSNIETGKLEIFMEDVRLDEIINDSIAAIMPLAQARDISVSLNNIGTCANCTVHADRTRTKQVILNLLSNAVKFNKNGGQISVDCYEQDEGKIRVSVTNTGSGIPADDIADIFQPFSRLYLRTFAQEGTGIGLTISKQLIELMQGEIGVESTLGEGATFWIALNKAPTMRAPSEIKRKDSASGIKEDTSKQHLILYIEDSPSHIDLMESIFSNEPNIKLITGHTPQLGLELAAAHTPDLILLDICLPGMDGYEVLKQLKSTEKTADIPVVALSASAMPHEIENALRAGFRRYLTKPINIEEVRKAVDDLVKDIIH